MEAEERMESEQRWRTETERMGMEVGERKNRMEMKDRVMREIRNATMT